ncbi:MAG: hypothetical protein HY646_14445 [Acidobacteria bacterium]|nr:hypothetical protein [Acidobacteriota bacterium]
MKRPLTFLLPALLVGVLTLVPTTAGQIRVTPGQGPVETTPRILDILTKIRKQSDTLRASIDEMVRATSQARARIAAGTPEDRQRALVVAQQMMSKTLVQAKKSSEETALLFDSIDAELTQLQRDSRNNSEQLRRFKKNIEDEIGKQEVLLASVVVAADNLSNILPAESRSRLPGVLATRNAVREALLDAYRNQHRHLDGALEELGSETDSAIAELRGRVQGQAEDARFYANSFGQFASQMAVQLETDRIIDGVDKRRQDMDKVEDEITNGNQPIADLLRALGDLNELQRAVDEDRRRARELRKKRNQ